MKKIILLIISSIISLGLFTACSSSKEPNIITNKKPISIVKLQDVREVAYNQLNSNEKERIRGTWKNGQLSKIILKKGFGKINNKSYIGKEIYFIVFQTKGGVQSEMVVYLAMDNKKLIGFGFSD